MKKFRIPQEVQIEDRIFGPITMRRLIILTAGGAFTYMFYVWGKDTGFWAWFPFVFFFGTITLALAFIEPFGMRFEKFATRCIEFFSLPRVNIWDKRFSQDVFFQYIEYSHKQWEKKSKKQDPTENVVLEKQRKHKEVSEMFDLLENDLSQMEVSRYTKKI